MAQSELALLGESSQRNFPIKSYLLWKSNNRYQFKITTLSSRIVMAVTINDHDHQWLEMVAQDWRRRSPGAGAGTGRRADTRIGNGTDPKTRSARKSLKKVTISVMKGKMMRRIRMMRDGKTVDKEREKESEEGLNPDEKDFERRKMGPSFVVLEKK